MQSIEHPDCGSDGWRKKVCAAGAALMNFIVMGDNISQMVSVEDYSDHRKDAKFIAEALITQAAVIAERIGCERERLAGWVLDNTKTNWAAIRIVQEKYPMWIMRGCIAHCLALAIKDFCVHSTTKGRYAQSWGCKWVTAANQHANTIANFMGDCLGARQILQKHQLAILTRKHAITVSMPMRFATNLLVMSSVLKSEAAFKAAVTDPEWGQLPGGNKSELVRSIVEQQAEGAWAFWADLRRAVQLLQPFSDMIHQIEADRPALGRCFTGLLALDKHVRTCCEQYATDVPHVKGEADLVLKTWQRRYTNEHGSTVQQLMAPAYTAAYLLDPVYAVITGSANPQPPSVPLELEDGVRDLVRRVGGEDGEAAVGELTSLLLTGWPASCKDAVKLCTQTDEVSFGAGAQKRKRNQVADLAARKGVWKRYGAHHFPKLTPIALRLLCCHPTSCAAERNWSLWGRVFQSSRSALALERARKMISFCFNSRAQGATLSDFDLTLAVVANDVDAL